MNKKGKMFNYRKQSNRKNAFLFTMLCNLLITSKIAV